MNKDTGTNKSGDTDTASQEYIKRESGEQDVPKVPAENPGNTSPNCDDLEHPEQKAEDRAAEEGVDDEVAEKIEETNEENRND